MPTTRLHTHGGTSRGGHLGGDHLDTAVRDVMTPGVVTIAEDASLVQVLRAVRAHDVHAVLVVGKQHARPLGWITTEGLLGFIGDDAALMSARDAVTEQVTTIDPLASARDALAALSDPGTTHLLVCRHSDGAAEGVVSAINLITLERG
ncbi:MAG TPA: CBS domain-containing protein [Thermoleophilaceae bacterium]|jgi:CBS domain-containing protein